MRRDPAEAARAFTRSYQLSCADALLLNLGRCYELLGDTRSAIDVLEVYLERQPEAPGAAEVRRRIEALRGR